MGELTCLCSMGDGQIVNPFGPHGVEASAWDWLFEEGGSTSVASSASLEPGSVSFPPAFFRPREVEDISPPTAARRVVTKALNTLVGAGASAVLVDKDTDASATILQVPTFE